MASWPVCAGSGRAGRAIRFIRRGPGPRRVLVARRRRAQKTRTVIKLAVPGVLAAGSNRFNGPTRRWEPAQRTIAPVRRTASRAPGVNRVDPEGSEVTRTESNAALLKRSKSLRDHEGLGLWGLAVDAAGVGGVFLGGGYRLDAGSQHRVIVSRVASSAETQSRSRADSMLSWL
jgi:hypothetical protein